MIINGVYRFETLTCITVELVNFVCILVIEQHLLHQQIVNFAVGCYASWMVNSVGITTNKRCR